MVVKPRILRGALADAGLLALGLIAAFPLLWLVCASLKDAKDLSAYLLHAQKRGAQWLQQS